MHRPFLAVALLVVTATSCVECDPERRRLAAIPDTYETQCWGPELFEACQSCASGGADSCCTRDLMGCTRTPSCNASNQCKYLLQDQCECLPGECSADGTQVCACSALEDGGLSSAWSACPAEHPRCDTGKRTCVCEDGASFCVDSSTQRTCFDGGYQTSTCEFGLTCNGGKCTCPPMAERGCRCPAGQCAGREKCGADGRWGACSCVQARCGPNWQLNGNYCSFERSEPGGTMNLSWRQSQLQVLFSTTIPAECANTNACAVRVMVPFARPSCPGATIIFRCDGKDTNQDQTELLLDYVGLTGPNDTLDERGGPQFACREKLEILTGFLPQNSTCMFTANSFKWTGEHLASCP